MVISFLSAVSASYYLSEGATGAFFTTEILIANGTEDNAPVTLTAEAFYYFDVSLQTERGDHFAQLLGITFPP